MNQEILYPFECYVLKYNDGDTQNIKIRLPYEEAKELYLNKRFSYWHEPTQSEKYHVVESIEPLNK